MPRTCRAAAARPSRAQKRADHGLRCPRARERAELHPERHHARKSAPKPLTGPRGLPNQKSDTRRPSRGAGARAPGRSRRPHRRREHSAKARARGRSHGRSACVFSPAGAAASLATDIISSAPARPSPAPRGVARVPAPLLGLRCRHPNRRGSQRTRQTPLCASRRPRPRRTTWLGTPTAP